MKKMIVLLLLAILSGFTLNCRQPSVPENSFRVKTRVKFSLYGIPLPFSVPNPNIAINLKTNTAPNTPGTTGSITEFAPGGAYVVTNGLFSGGYFDAVNAVTPAFWTAKVAPNQNRCRVDAANNNVGFNVVNRGTYRINCGANITVRFLIEPDFLDLSNREGNNGENHLTGVIIKDLSRKAVFSNGSTYKAQWYAQSESNPDDFEFDREVPVIWTSPDGSEARFRISHGRSTRTGIVIYKILIVEEENLFDPYVGYGELTVMYPEYPSPCPGGGNLCQ